ncbi:hypothetical protein D3C71_2082320 [compost metagenome]
MAAYSGNIAQKASHSAFSHIWITRSSRFCRNGLQILVANSGAWPFWAKRCDSEPLARKATVPSYCSSTALRMAQPRRALSFR